MEDEGGDDHPETEEDVDAGDGGVDLVVLSGQVPPRTATAAPTSTAFHIAVVVTPKTKGAGDQPQAEQGVEPRFIFKGPKSDLAWFSNASGKALTAVS